MPLGNLNILYFSVFQILTLGCFLTPTGCSTIQFYSDTIYLKLPSDQISQVKGFSATKLPPLQMQLQMWFPGYSHFCLADYKLEGSLPPSPPYPCPKFSYFLEQVTKLRRHLHLPVYFKRYNSGTATWKKMHRGRCGESWCTAFVLSLRVSAS